jgi:hypothetical protein
MTTPATGAISISDINTEVGRTSTYSTDMAWIKANAKTTIGGATGIINDFDNLHNKAWYSNSTAGNCNNANCTTGACNCGNKGNCVNCYTTAINCSNCDASVSYLQPNCNCACTYNCTQGVYTVACDCACNVQCDCSACKCSLEDAEVTMSDGSIKLIKDVIPGDYVLGPRGETNKVLAIENHKLGLRSMYKINKERNTTSDHPHLGADGKFYGIKTEDVFYSFGKKFTALTESGNMQDIVVPSVDKESVKTLAVGVNLETLHGPKTVTEIEEYGLPPETLIYSLIVDGSHIFYADGYAISGWINDYDFDYDLWMKR